ncbi:Down syndrome cell adhesion molecule homolog [Limulus polyphemus]|uniref:Down syndrome cell adhesion molecule homolog n=1 Tax=Limulus polyphemus TaxID=6850 RepID=A0ABM1TMK1_LIMPO|nr:Down syndrome cell adhesion molecule homolog [Limulus polyphemus]
MATVSFIPHRIPWILIVFLIGVLCEGLKIKPFHFSPDARVGEDLQVLCSTVGVKNGVKFTWFKDSSIIQTEKQWTVLDHGTFSVLVVKSPSVESSGNYTCVARASNGEDTYTAQLLVRGSPKWRYEPRDILVSLGEDSILYCSAWGYPQPIVQWKRPLGTGMTPVVEDARISKLEDGSLRILDVTQNDRGSYMCEVSNGIGGSLKKTVQLSVKGNEWRPLEHPVLEKGVLDIRNIKLQDGGRYRCQITNGLGEGLQKTVSLVVRVPPRIQPFGFPAFAEEGKQIQFICGLETHDTGADFKWFKDGRPLHSGDKWTILSPGRVSVLILNSVTTEISGNYTCGVRNSVGQDEFTTELRVKGPPKWKYEPTDLESGIGETVTFRCSAWGFPKPSISWMKQEVKGNFVQVPKGSESEDTFIIEDVSQDDAGLYTCLVTNGIGESLKKTFTFSVRGGALVWHRGKKNSGGALYSNTAAIRVSVRIQPFTFPQKVEEGEQVQITCGVKAGDDPIEFVWFKDSTPLETKDFWTIHNLSRVSLLIINNVKVTISGNYTCLARNRFGEESYTSELQVKGPPQWKSKPKDQIANLGEKVVFICNAYGYPKPTVQWWKVSGIDTKLPISSLDQRLKDNEGLLVISKVTEADGGVFKCEASNEIGDLSAIVNLKVKGIEN